MKTQNMIANLYLGPAYQINLKAAFGKLLKNKQWSHKQEAFVYIDPESGDLVVTKSLEKARKMNAMALPEAIENAEREKRTLLNSYVHHSPRRFEDGEHFIELLDEEVED